MKNTFKSISITAEALPYIELTCLKSLGDLVKSMIDKGLTLATAESCTGGLVGSMITEIPGVSAVYLGGIVSYTNQIKTDILGVNPETIAKHTEVSAETASEMAERVREKFVSDIGVSVTGFAGPGGGNDKDPVGTVYIAVATKNETRVLRLSLDSDSDRAQVRRTAAHVIFAMVERVIQKGI